MDINSRNKEICHGCSKNMLKHHRFVICNNCEKICHAKCADKLYRFNLIEDSWCCWECSSLEESRYNPFKSYKYDKYSQPDTNIFEEIHKLEHILNDCKRLNYSELKSLIAKSNDPLSITFKNIDGVASNFDTFSTELMLNNSNISILALAETNLDETNKNLYNLPSFQSEYQSKIPGKSKGSGLAIYVKENFLYTRKEEFCQCTPNLESLFISINNTETPTYIGVVYRPPNGDPKSFLSELNLLLQKLPLSNVHLTGDFNTDLLKSTIYDFEDTMYGNGFAPLISIATHFKPGCKPSCIDNILTNSTDKIISSGVCDTAANHHMPIFCLIRSKWNESVDEPAPPRYDYNESNMSRFENLFSAYVTEKDNFNKIEANEENFESLVGKMNKLVDECFLMDVNMLNSRRNRINNPWITTGIIASISKRDNLYKLWRKSIKLLKTKEGDPILYGNYKLYRKQLNTIISCAKRSHRLKQFEKVEGNSRQTWKLINEIRGKQKTKIKPSFIIDGNLVEERRVIADSFNKYFTSIASTLNESVDELPITPIPVFTDYVKNSVESSIFLTECYPSEIECLIKELSSSKSSDVPITVLKRISTTVAPILSKFYNKFMSIGIFPNILKNAIVSPVYKKDDPQKLDNYRPISTLPVFSKLFEKLIYIRMYSFLVSKNVLYEKQFGFRKNHSTSHAINYSVNYVATKIEEKKHVIGLFLDLSKAFDTICHRKLLIKLQNYGIRGNCLELLKSYLHSRTQITKFNNTKSDSEFILYGVPQGSVLGPLLFLLYINDIINCTHKGEFVIFADDTNIFVSANTKKDAYTIANDVLKSVYIYLKTNQLHINLSKCAHIYFRPNLNNTERLTCARIIPHNERLTIAVNGKKIKQVDKIKFLGVIIDENLTWDDQIKHLENKLLATIVLIKRIKKFIPSSHYKKIYQSLFVSHLTYGISCWGGVYPSKLQKLFNTQKRCLRILFGESLSYDHSEYYLTCARTRTYEQHIALKDFTLEHTKPLFNKNGFLTLHNLYTVRSLIELFKILKLQSPTPIYSNFKLCPKTHHFKLLCPKFKLDISKNNFTVNSILLWNSCINKLLDQPTLYVPKFTNGLALVIPGNIKNSDLTMSISSFKKRLVDLLLKLQSQGDSNEWSKSNTL